MKARAAPGRRRGMRALEFAAGGRHDDEPSRDGGRYGHGGARSSPLRAGPYALNLANAIMRGSLAAELTQATSAEQRPCRGFHVRLAHQAFAYQHGAGAGGG